MQRGNEMSTDPSASCVDCAFYYAAHSETGKGNITQKCEKDQEDGVAEVYTVTKESDCPYYQKPVIGLVEDVYPRRKISTDPERKAYVDTEQHGDDKSTDPYRDFPPSRKRRSDNY